MCLPQHAWARRTTTAAAAAVLLALTGCAAGQQTETSVAITMTGGAEGRAGSILVRNAAFLYADPVRGDTVYSPGATVPLRASIVNDASAADVGRQADRLVAVSSPIAESGMVAGNTRIADGQVLTAGYREPMPSVTLPGTRVIDIALVGLTQPLPAGLSYPVVFTFERAGELRLDVAVAYPDNIPAPRSQA